MNRNYTPESGVLQKVAIFLLLFVTMSLLYLSFGGDLFFDNPIFVLIMFGSGLWPFSFYSIYVLVKSFPFNCFPSLHCKFPTKIKIVTGFPAKIMALGCLLFFISSSIAPFLIYKTLLIDSGALSISLMEYRTDVLRAFES